MNLILLSSKWFEDQVLQQLTLLRSFQWLSVFFAKKNNVLFLKKKGIGLQNCLRLFSVRISERIFRLLNI